jgi:hypothetical protein
VILIKTKIILLLKFRPKLSRTSRQYQSNGTTCHVINFFDFFKKINLKNIYFIKKKMWPFGDD